MVTINHTLIHRENEHLRVSRNINLECIQTVLRLLPNIKGIGLLRATEMDGLDERLKPGLITVVELDPHELTEQELEVLSHLGLELPLISKRGNEIEVSRLNLDMDDIRTLQRL